jgi:predicted DNA-binding protein (UPF0251 family)
MSPRYKKQRRCGCPFGDLQRLVFKPAGIPSTELQQVTIYRDEVEALRLCDLEGLTQEEAGVRMGVSRGTVQRLLASARRKMAEAVTTPKAIIFAAEIDGRVTAT